MAFMGDLVVKLGMDSKKFTNGINQAQSGLSKFGSMATSLLNPITAGFAAVAAGAASAGVAVYKFAGRIAELAAVADKAAQTGLSGAFIQRLGYAADQSGVSIETLHKAIGKLTIISGQAQSGSKAASGALGALGINAKTLKGMSPEQQFRRVAEAISKIPTAAGRASAAVSVFGKTGIETTTLFAGGMDDLNKLLAEAEALGIGVSDDGLAKAARADDAIQRMKASFGALFDQITVGVAPAFELVSTAIADLVPPITKFFNKFNGMEDKVKWIGDVLVAGIDVGIELIKVHWSTMLTDMVNMAADAAKQIAINMVPGAAIVKWGAENAFGGAGGQKQGGLAAAQARFDDVIARLGPDDKGIIRKLAPALQNRPKAGGGDLAGLAGGLAEGAMGLFDKAALAAQNKMTDLQIKGGFLGSIVENMFGVGPGSKDPEQIKKEQVKTAGAMQKGSQEAFSTIVQAMLGKGKDPNVNATEKQTIAIVKALKANKPPKFDLVNAFAGAFQ